MAATLEAFLNGTKYGLAYLDMPLGSDKEIFNTLCWLLHGKLENPFGPNFTPPGLLDPDYVAPNKGIRVMTFGLVSSVVATLVVILRLFVRSAIKGGGANTFRRGGRSQYQAGWNGLEDTNWWRPWRRWGWRFGNVGWDDWTMVIALVFFAGYTTLNVLATRNGGMGKHLYDVSFNQVEFLLKTTYAHTTIYFTLSFFIKLSILLLYLRLFDTGPTSFRPIIYTFVFLLLAYTITACMVVSFMCHPIEAYWTLVERVGGSCPEQEGLAARYTSVLAIHVTCDFLVFLIPMPYIWHLQHQPLQKKILLGTLLSAGAVACIASILRLVYFPAINQSIDVTSNIMRIVLWGQVEAFLAMVCASLPSLNPLILALKANLAAKRPELRDSRLSAAGFGNTLLASQHTQERGLFQGHGHSRNASSISEMSGPRTPQYRSPMQVPGGLPFSRQAQDLYDASLREIDSIVTEADLELGLSDGEQPAVTEAEPCRSNGRRRRGGNEGHPYIDSEGRLAPVPPPSSTPSSGATTPNGPAAPTTPTTLTTPLLFPTSPPRVFTRFPCHLPVPPPHDRSRFLSRAEYPSTNEPGEESLSVPVLAPISPPSRPLLPPLIIPAIMIEQSQNGLSYPENRNPYSAPVILEREEGRERNEEGESEHAGVGGGIGGGRWFAAATTLASRSANRRSARSEWIRTRRQMTL